MEAALENTYFTILWRDSVEGSYPAIADGIGIIHLQAPASLHGECDVLASLNPKVAGMGCCTSKPLRPHCREHNPVKGDVKGRS